MLTRIGIQAGWHRYKSDTPIDPGFYLVFSARPTEPQKRALGLVAASSPQGRFCWLAPDEPWVRRVVTGLLDAPSWGQSVPTDWPLFGLSPAGLRPWQQVFLADAFSALSQGLPYRRAAVITMGAGKTLVGLALCQISQNAVVAASAYLHQTWREEAKKWGLRCPTLSTYESLHKLPPPDVLIIDEALALKNPDSLRHRRCAQQAAHARVVVGLTGTPTSGGGPLDWRWLRVVQPGAVPAGDTPWRFLFGLDTQLVEVVPGRKAYQTRVWDTDRIAHFVAPYTLSVAPQEILASLPEITYRMVAVPTPKDYPLVAAGGATAASQSKRVAQCRQVSDGFIQRDDDTIVRVAHQPKIDALVEWVEGLDEPIVIYAAWTGTLDLLYERLGHLSPAMLRGDTSDPGAEQTRFKSGATRVLLANARMSQGMNLQEHCRVMAFASWSLSPTDRIQAVARIHRPGQKRGCQVIDFVCEDTLDMRTLELLNQHNHLSAEQIERLLHEHLF